MDHSVKITREALLHLLNGVSYNVDGSVVKGTEVVRNYRMKLNDEGKVEINVFNVPVEIKWNGNWVDMEDVLAEEDLLFIREMFSEVHLEGRIVLDTDNMDGLSIRGRDRVRQLSERFAENSVNYPREFTWVDGASDISGVIELPYDDYSQVYIVTDPDDEGIPQLLFIPTKADSGGERPYYVKEDGKTLIYVNHFSGGGGTQADPYIVSNEDDLNKVRNNLGAYYIQDADIVLTKWQTGAGFTPITDFKGYYDGRGFEIKNLYINKSGSYTGLFGYQSAGVIQRVRLVNVNITSSGGGYVGALVGRQNGSVYDCQVSSGTVNETGRSSYVGGLVGYKDTNRYLYRSCSHADVSSNGSNVGGLVGRNAGSNEGEISQCLATGKVKDTSIAQTGTYFGGFLGYGVCSDNNFFDTDTTGMQVSAGDAQGFTTNDLKKNGTYANAGWDFDLYFYMKRKKLNRGYPENRKFIRYAKGKGTEADPFLIYDFEDLNQVRHFPWASFRMENDITIDYPRTGEGFVGIGFGGTVGWATSEAFYGVFDGNGMTIGGLFQNRPRVNYQGLFQYFRGVLKNLNLVDADVTGNSYSGAVIGQGYTKIDGSKSEITNVHVKSFNGTKIRGSNNFVGGFIGYSHQVIITDCSVDAEVIGSSNYIGGFAGRIWTGTWLRRVRVKGKAEGLGDYVGGAVGEVASNNSDIKLYDVLVRVDVTGRNNCAGVFGYVYYTTNSLCLDMENVISLCYTTGMSSLNGIFGIFTISNSSAVVGKEVYFDRQSHNSTTSGGRGSAKYTSELKHESTYVNNAWDFENVWILDEEVNDGYPELRFSIPTAAPILGFRNQFGDYYTDAQGSVLRHLEYGTLVAGSVADPRPVWLQNNADFPVTNMRTWVDLASVKPGITVELSLTNNPFVPMDEIVFPGTIPAKDARKFFVRFSSNVDVTEGGTFDLRAKASPL